MSAVILILLAFLTGFSAADAKLNHTIEKRCDFSKPPGSPAWVNDWDGPFQFRCPNGQTISRMKSIYKECTRDRLWAFSCRSTAELSSGVCLTTDYVNEWDLPLFYMCPLDGVITGIESMHNNYREDRRFKITCCKNRGHITYGCETSPYINTWKGDMDFSIPSSHVMVGLFSYHRNDQEDRIWKALICRIGTLGEY